MFLDLECLYLEGYMVFISGPMLFTLSQFKKKLTQ